MPKLEIKSDAKPFTMIKNAIIDSEEILNEHEKILYIVLMRYGNKAFPSLSTISKKCGFSKRTAQRTIDALIEKGLLKKRNRTSKKTGNTSNVYTLIDNDKIWQSAKEDLQKNIDAALLEEAVRIVEASGMKVLDKEKKLASEPTTEQKQAVEKYNIPKENNTISGGKSQLSNNSIEKYTMEDVKIFFDYDILLQRKPLYKNDIDAVIEILYDTLNTSKTTIRVQGTEKPASVVIGKLMKLYYEDILYVIDKYNEQTERIKNPTNYILTLLYTAREQITLDIGNQVRHDMMNGNI